MAAATAERRLSSGPTALRPRRPPSSRRQPSGREVLGAEAAAPHPAAQPDQAGPRVGPMLPTGMPVDWETSRSRRPAVGSCVDQLPAPGRELCTAESTARPTRRPARGTPGSPAGATRVDERVAGQLAPRRPERAEALPAGRRAQPAAEPLRVAHAPAARPHLQPGGLHRVRGVGGGRRKPATVARTRSPYRTTISRHAAVSPAAAASTSSVTVCSTHLLAHVVSPPSARNRR